MVVFSGQESAGIVMGHGNNAERFEQHRKMGLVTTIFTREVLTKLKGNLGIGNNLMLFRFSLFLQGSGPKKQGLDTRVPTQKTWRVSWVNPPKKPAKNPVVVNLHASNMNATIFVHLKQLLTQCNEDVILTTYHIASGSKNVHVRSMQIYNDFVVLFM